MKNAVFVLTEKFLSDAEAPEAAAIRRAVQIWLANALR